MSTAWLLWALAMPGFAGVPVALPASEATGDWSDAFEVAGLEVALRPGDAEVRVEVGSGSWRLVALKGGQAVRVVTVPAPTSPAQRVETSFLVRALARSIEPLAEPAESLALPAPAPPEWFETLPPAAPPSVPAAMAPGESSEAEAVAQPAAEAVASAGHVALGGEEPVVVDVLEPAGNAEEPAESAVAGPEVHEPDAGQAVVAGTAAPADVAAAEGEPERVRHPLLFPPIAVGVGAAWRGETTTVAGVLGLQLVVARWGPIDLGFEGVATTPRRVLFILADQYRTYSDLRVSSVVRWTSALVQPELTVGIGRRAFYQSQLVKEMVAPFVGVGVEAAADGHFAPGLRLRANVDLRGMRLVSDTGRAFNLPRIDFGADVVVRIRPRHDPFTEMPTPLWQ